MNRAINILGRKLRLGVIGGGVDSFIGTVHRGAALLHEQFEVTASVLSSNPERSLNDGKTLGIPRPYATAEDLFAGEKDHPEKIDLLAIMTPNNSHYELSLQALDCGMDIFCEKPLTMTLEESEDLAAKLAQTDRIYCVAYAYTGYAMVRQARAMVEAGDLGELRSVQCDYIQGHLAELGDNEADNWHMKPEVAGESLILGDIGTHCFHLASYITGENPQDLCADVTSIVPGRTAHDYCGVLLRYANGARGSFTVTQAIAGGIHGLKIRVSGSKGTVEWDQESPDELIHRTLNSPERRLVRGGKGLHEAAHRATHVAMGHPEGYKEAFANLYLDIADHMLARHQGQKPEPLALWYPDIQDGVDGMKFIKAALTSSQQQSAWQALG
ncbi:Gfo/Idh/MocA family protein [Leucothrix pacifica]|uniref:Oxidoreductase n=1 Tax=Leucothrix pacifica TaxID=1247513 RepID=A0A317C3N2_9GAMM|nr:Gfo/Idh/MocA family oxidoreductase [Leucothrix pacifica]PWQ93306.1 oxidoreductase [Leucothrix pacifica]